MSRHGLNPGPSGQGARQHTERHAVGAQLLAGTQAQALLASPDSRLRPLADLFTRVAAHPAGNRALTDIITALDTRYDMVPGTAHPWLGRLAPNLALTIGTGRTDLAALLARGRGLLLNLTGKRDIREAAAGWADRVDIVDAACRDHPELRAVLLRPDGHTAWLRTAGDDYPDGLRQALQYWYGPAA